MEKIYENENIEETIQEDQFTEENNQILGIIFLSDSIGIVVDSIIIDHNNKTYKIKNVLDIQKPEVTNALQNLQINQYVSKTQDENGNVSTFLTIDIGKSRFPLIIDNLLIKFLYKNPLIRVLIGNEGVPVEIVKINVNKDYLIEEAL